MKQTKKSNRVSWAIGRNLCQVKLFSYGDYPTQVDQGLQDTSFEFSHITQIKWECPLTFSLSSHWLVAAGEESMEKEVEMLREMRVLEAFYPRLSDIPPSPSVSSYAEEETYDDNITPLIPIIPIEEEESIPINTLPELAEPVEPHSNVESQSIHQYTSPGPSSMSSDCNTSCTLLLDGLCRALSVDLGTASTVVAAAIKKNNEQGNPVDMDLLIQILNDPKMIEQLMSQTRMAATSASPSSNALLSPPKPNVATFGSTVRSNVGLSLYGLRLAPHTTISSSELSTASSMPPSGNLHNVVNWVQTSANTTPYQPNTGSSSTSTSTIGNGNGGDKQVDLEKMKLVNNKQGEVKRKIQKPCIYFNSKRGCRNGNNCAFQHDVSVQSGAGSVLRVRNAKKLRL